MNAFRAPSTIALIAVCAGLVLVIIGQANWTFAKLQMGSLIANLGAFIALIGAINFIYENIQRQSFMEDVRDSVIGASNVTKAGIIDFCENSKKYDFSELIQKSDEITTVFNFTSRFVDDYRDDLKSFLNRGGVLRLIFITSDGKAIEAMRSFGYAEHTISSNFDKLNSAIEDLKTCGSVSTVNVDATIKYGLVLFDNDGFHIASTSSSGRHTVPMIHFSRGGNMWRFIEQDVKILQESANE